MSVYYSSPHLIRCHVYSADLKSYFLLSVVYASNDMIQRRKLWKALSETTEVISDEPWLVLGDCNVIRDVRKSSDFLRVWQLLEQCKTSEIIYMMFFCLICKLGVLIFTWTNKRSANFLAKKLDRIRVNDSWLQAFSQNDSGFRPPEFSYHMLIGLIGSLSLSKTPNPLNFLIFYPSMKVLYLQWLIHGEVLLCRDVRCIFSAKSLKLLSQF